MLESSFNCSHNGHFHEGILHDGVTTRLGCLRNETSLEGFGNLSSVLEMKDSTVVNGSLSLHRANDLQMTPHLRGCKINKSQREKREYK